MKHNLVLVKCISGVLALAGTVLSLKAQTPAYVIRDGNIYPAASEKNPAFKTSAEPRKEYGAEHYVAAWGGANLLQQGDEAKIKGYGESLNLSLKSSAGFAAGFKVGQIWNFENNGDKLVIYGEKKSVTFMPSIEGEFIYAGNKGAKAEWNGRLDLGGGDAVDKIYQKFDMEIFAFMVNPILRAQWGPFRPYAGFGLGGAYVSAKGKGIFAEGTAGGDPVTERVTSNGSDSDIAFAFQGLVGTDFFLNKDWSIFLEYKYLGLVGLKFDAVGGAKYDMGDVYGNHLVTMGVKLHY